MFGLCRRAGINLGKRRFLPECRSKTWFTQQLGYCNQRESVQDVIASIIKDSKVKDSINNHRTSKLPNAVSGIHEERTEIKRNDNGSNINAHAYSPTDIASDIEIETAEPVKSESKIKSNSSQSHSARKVLKALGSLTDEEAETLAFIKSVKVFQPLTPELEENGERFREFVEGLKIRNLPSVTKVISVTQTDYQKYLLERWKLKMIEELGLQGFEEYQKETFAKGHKLHGAIQQRLSEEKPDITPNIEGYWRSLQPVIPAIEQVFSLEDHIQHPHLHYKGIFDCLAVYRGCPCVIDWKTSSKPKPTLRDTYDYPLQMVAYLGALNQSDYLIEKGIPPVSCAALIVVYENGDPAHIHFLDAAKCQTYWRKWLDKLHQYWLLRSNEAS